MGSLFDISGKVAVIIGSSGGLGQVISRGLAAAQVKVVLASRNQSANEQLVNEIVEAGGEAFACQVDITELKELEALKDTVLDWYGDVDFLINCAGMTIKKPLIEVNTDEWEKVQLVNLQGVFLSCQVFSRVMIANKKGRIINFASLGSFVGIKTSAPYCAAKGGVLQLTKVLAMELAPYGINVNAVTPGVLDTPLASGIKGNQEAYQRLMNRLPLGRLGKAEEIIGPVLFLCSPAADYITGISLPVDGGFLASGI
ncbi:MAG: hypothetical protein PWR10_2376 [Halanaerobiales bacterium]|nr:hypothetical protein [Halanaerobiales bacterium]